TRETLDSSGVGETRPAQLEPGGLDHEGVVDDLAGKHSLAPILVARAASRGRYRKRRRGDGIPSPLSHGSEAFIWSFDPPVRGMPAVAPSSQLPPFTLPPRWRVQPTRKLGRVSCRKPRDLPSAQRGYGPCPCRRSRPGGRACRVGAR